MENEMKSFLRVWSIAMSLTFYTYYVSSKIPKGFLRLISLFPVFYFFTILPLNLNSVHLCFLTTLFLTWFANFKLFLFAFHLQPFNSPSLFPTPFHFFALLCLPVLIIQKPTKPEQQLQQTHQTFATTTVWAWGLKILALAIVVISYIEFRNYLHPNFVFILTFCHLYLALEITMAISSFPIEATLGIPMERQYNQPYLSTSLENFWGRRWNRMAPSILRPTIYNPIRTTLSPVVGKMWAYRLAVLGSFIVSGLMHELISYYLTRVTPTWEMTWFFVIHGVCLGVEVAVKSAVAGRVKVPPVVSRVLTLTFMGLTGKRFIFDPLNREGMAEKMMYEYKTMFSFVKPANLLT